LLGRKATPQGNEGAPRQSRSQTSPGSGVPPRTRGGGTRRGGCRRAGAFGRTCEGTRRRGRRGRAPGASDRAHPDPLRRAGRALTAAQAKFDAAAREAALELLAAADPARLDELPRARRARLRAQIAFVRTRGPDAARLLLEAARRLDPFIPALARGAYLEALRAAIFAGRLVEGSNVHTVADAARSAPPRDGRPAGSTGCSTV
jgi:hypothetical protein